MTELVITRTLLRIGEHLVRLVEFLEAGLRFLVVGMQVGVAGLGCLAVCFFDFVIRGILGYAKHLVVISLLCHSSHHLF